MIDNGSPEPEFHTDDDRTHFLTVLPANMEAYEDETDEDTIDDTDKNERVNAPALNERQKKAIDYVKEHGSITRNEYQVLFDVSSRTAIRDLKALSDGKFINKVGTTKGSIYVIINGEIMAR
jgi:predicted HTH transcriptional regulator